MEGGAIRKWTGPPFPAGVVKEMVGALTFLQESYWKSRAPTFLKESLRKSYSEKWSEVHVCHLLFGERGGGAGGHTYGCVATPPLG